MLFLSHCLGLFDDTSLACFSFYTFLPNFWHYCCPRSSLLNYNFFTHRLASYLLLFVIHFFVSPCCFLHISSCSLYQPFLHSLLSSFILFFLLTFLTISFLVFMLTPIISSLLLFLHTIIFLTTLLT